MARRCELTGKGVMSGNNVSHSHVKTKRRFLPNLQHVTMHSEALGQRIRLRVSTHAVRTVEIKGGIDNFLRQARPHKLSLRAQRLKRAIEKINVESATA